MLCNSLIVKMKRYSKYIITRILGPLVFITLGFTGLAWLTQSLRFVDLIINRGLGVGMFIYLSSLLLPSLVTIILPVALFASVVFAYHRLMLDSELTIFANVGLSRRQLMKPAITLALIVMILGYSVAFYVMPSSYRKFKDMQAFIRDNYASVMLQEGVFNTMIKGLTVYIRGRDNKGMLYGILVHDSRNERSPVTMMAESGQLLQTPTGPQFLLINGNRQEINNEQEQISILHFDRYAVELSQFTTATVERHREPEERFFGELIMPEKDIPQGLKDRLNVEIHTRLLWSLSSLFTACVAMASFISGEFNRRGQVRRALLSACICVAYFSVLVGLINGLAPLGPAVILVYLYVIAACIFGYLICVRDFWLYRLPILFPQ